jgi:hypothetical protein
MSRARPLVLAALLPVVAARVLAAQSWNGAAVRALVDRGIARRSDATTGLTDFRARAHGFVFFLAQLGEQGLDEPPRLIRSDQLELEVYWKAPNVSKQRIIGWRDRVDLPTDIQYHRDHLGIVQNGFGDRIRLGQGDEVRDVPHPLARDGPSSYDYALVDSLTIGFPGRAVRVHQVEFRPKDFSRPGIVGSLFLDADDGDLVQLRFSFTRAAYRDESLEDITIFLENGLWDGRYWLPRRQEIEIRRRSTWLDVPARGIIRGRWEIDGYRINTAIPDRTFLGAEIVAAPTARDSFPWPEPIDAAIADVLGPQRALNMDEVRDQVWQLAAGRSLSGLRPAALSIASFSQVLHVNRVEGLAVGAGAVARPEAGVALHGWASFGFSDEHLKGGVRVRRQGDRWWVGAVASREVHDIGDQPVISGVVNTVLAQEAGRDFGDYVRLDRLEIELGRRGLAARFGLRRSASLAVGATPATGRYRPNPALGSGDWVVGVVELSGGAGGRDAGGWARGTAALEGGCAADSAYARLWASGALVVPTGVGELALTGAAGWGSHDLPRDRTFVLGGRGTLVGEPFRAYGGRWATWARLDWRVPVPFPAIPLGPYASTGQQLVVAPFVAAGWAGSPVAGLPWTTSDGVRPVLGLALDVFHRLVRVEAGWGIRARGVGVTVDVRRELWPLL